MGATSPGAGFALANTRSANPCPAVRRCHDVAVTAAIPRMPHNWTERSQALMKSSRSFVNSCSKSP